MQQMSSLYRPGGLVFANESGGKSTTVSGQVAQQQKVGTAVVLFDTDAGLVESEQGRGGGSRLARPANQITLRDAVEAAEGPFDVTHCIMKDRACGEGVRCVIHEAWEIGQRVTLEYLATQTLADFVFNTTSRTLPPAS
jgi:Rrf2 family protein